MLLRALEEKDIETVNELIARSPSLVAEGLGSSRALHSMWQREEAKSSIVDFLIKSGAPLEARDNDGATPLHHAAAYGRSEAAEILLDAGANPSESIRQAQRRWSWQPRTISCSVTGPLRTCYSS